MPVEHQKKVNQVAWPSKVGEEESLMIGQLALCTPKKAESLVWTKPALKPDRWGQPARGGALTHKKERKNLKIENPSKISTAQTVFLLQFLSIEKLYVFKKERNCKDSVSSIVKFIEWTLLHTSVRQLRHFYSSKRKKERKKNEKEEKGLLRDIFCLVFSCWPNIAGI